jgi:hypothetical protein
MFKWRGIRLVGHVARMGYRRGSYIVLVDRPQRWRPLGDLSVDGMIKYKSILRK